MESRYCIRISEGSSDVTLETMYGEPLDDVTRNAVMERLQAYREYMGELEHELARERAAEAAEREARRWSGVGRIIRVIRGTRRWSLEELAAAANVDYAFLQALETGDFKATWPNDRPWLTTILFT